MDRLADSLMEIIFCLDKNGNLLEINNHFRKALEYKEEEIINRHISSIVAKDALPRFLYNLQILLNKGQPGEFESELRSRANRTINVKIRLSTFIGSEGQVLVAASANDISDRKETLERLQGEGRKWRRIVENIREGIISIDKNGVITYANRPLAQLLGLDRGKDAIGKSIYSFIPENEHEHVKEHINLSPGEKNGASFEIVLGSPGNRRFLLVNGSIIDDNSGRGFSGTMEDITPQKKLLEDLAIRNQRLTSINNLSKIVGSSLELDEILAASLEYISEITEMSFSGVYLKDSGEFDIFRKVEFFSRLEGCKKRKIPSGDEDRAQMDFFSLVKWVMSTGKIVLVSNAKKDSRIKLSQDSKIKSLVAIPLKTKDDTVGALVLASEKYQRISREKEEIFNSMGHWMGMAVENSLLYEKIKDQAQRLEKANSYKDLFADIIRHDIITPAALVLSFSDLLILEEAEPDQKDILRRINRNANRIIAMVEDSAIFSRLESVEDLEKENLDLDKIIEEVLEALEHALEKNQMRIIYSPKKITLSAHPIIREVFMNLISNAIKYSPKGTEIGILCQEDEDIIRIAISDRGEGVEDQAKQSIFNRFERENKEFVKGHGLGLAIVKRIVELHWGRVWVEDNYIGLEGRKEQKKKQKKGSIFFLEFPKNR